MPLRGAIGAIAAILRCIFFGVGAETAKVLPAGKKPDRPLPAIGQAVHSFYRFCGNKEGHGVVPIDGLSAGSIDLGSLRHGADSGKMQDKDEEVIFFHTLIFFFAKLQKQTAMANVNTSRRFGNTSLSLRLQNRT